MPKETKRLLFNKKTGILIGDLPLEQEVSGISLDKFAIKEVEIDPIAEFWEGTYTDGKVKTVGEKARFTEGTVNTETTGEIEVLYSLTKQLNIIRNTIQHIGGENLPEEFAKMCDYIEDCVEKGKVKKKTYKESDAYDFVSTDDILKKDKLAADLE
tara:strand:+ start:1521 stop:1988 length:468 start_codon:yes stop_codon:yes gene_type:complete